MDWSEKSTYDITLTISEMQQEHNALKNEILVIDAKLRKIEKDFIDANLEIDKRHKVNI
tara:strand:- start:4111 stop:4287 length:177 start_codon:yes stop_codon:yes gene_type:complete